MTGEHGVIILTCKGSVVGGSTWSYTDGLCKRYVDDRPRWDAADCLVKICVDSSMWGHADCLVKRYVRC